MLASDRNLLHVQQKIAARVYYLLKSLHGVKTRTETCANMLLQKVSMPHISHLHVDAISSHQHLNHSMLAVNGKDVETFEEAPPGNSSHQQALALQQ